MLHRQLVTGKRIEPDFIVRFVDTTIMAVRPAMLVEAMVAHIGYIADRIGIEYVAFGSDLYRPPSQDNPEGVIPLDKALVRLREVGWTDRMLHQLAWENWRRVLAATWGV